MTSAAGMSTVDADLVEMMDGVFAAHRDTHPPADAARVDRALWSRLDDLGLVRLTGAEQHGGSGAGWYEAAALTAAAVHHAVRIPLAEHDLLACWLLEAVGVDPAPGVRTVAVLDADGAAAAVPWASEADRITVVWPTGDHIGHHMAADVEAAALRITPGTNAIGEPRDTVHADVSTLRGTPVAAHLVEELRLKSALVRAMQVSAALDRVLGLSVEHTRDRVQFGRPLAKFQAIQTLVADIAVEAALARATVESAVAAASTHGWAAPEVAFKVAAARSTGGHAAEVVVRNAHQVHGAIGTTREHRLHEYTRAALAWRSEFGSVRCWDDELARLARAAGGAGLWALITG
ncbi:acyl-CoA dehydrogenase family protein [Mycolicibacterium parafortuitum]|uniref:acyl-CoA dehydrogenase family protein n=1 Tax=Mycolicibacterium parafortuitum TaxID=39692 RepID=UPI0032C488AE